MKENIEKSINIVFEDDNIIVVNKPHNLLSHCNSNNNNNSVVSLLRSAGKKLYVADDPMRNGIVHRLDKDTSGLMVLAKNAFSYKNLVSQFKNREVLKVYVAYCWSIPMPVAGIIKKPISDFVNRKKVILSKIGKEAITQYKVLTNFENFFSEIECKILTGRTHQIRVHMQSIKCPLIGDQLYSKDRNFSKIFSDKLKDILSKFKRQALHSKFLSFKNPANKKINSFFIEQPYDMLELKDELVDEFDTFC